MFISTLFILSLSFAFSIFALNDINNSSYLKSFLIEVISFIIIYYLLKCCKKTTEKNYYQI